MYVIPTHGKKSNCLAWYETFPNLASLNIPQFPVLPLTALCLNLLATHNYLSFQNTLCFYATIYLYMQLLSPRMNFLLPPHSLPFSNLSLQN